MRPRTYHIIILYTLSILSIFGIIQIFRTKILDKAEYEPDKPNAYTIPYVLQEIKFKEGDSINILTYTANEHVDSLIANTQEIIRRNQWLVSQHEHIINDIRQENNNFIDKVNTWLTFWTAISAILCALIPMAIQFFNLRLERKRILSSIIPLKNDIIHFKTELKGLHITIQRERKISEGLVMLSTGVESSLIDPGKLTHDSYIYNLWSSICSFLSEKKDNILKANNLDDINKFELIDLLLHMYDYMNQLQRIIPKYNSRKFFQCNDKIRELYKSILENKYTETSEIKNEFNNCISLFRGLLNN